jgi:sucrose phosphorylase
MLRVLFFYISKGARIIRLDAIAYLWKETGTSCIHLPQTHKIVKFIRELAELINPDIIILTQTNFPDQENRSYFGKNLDEAHMVHQFPLPPLILYTLHTGNSEKLTEWTHSIPDTEGEATYFNFTAYHDGIEVRPAEGIIPGEEISKMAGKMEDFGGYISTETKQDGSESPCEINITWFDALKGTNKGEDNLQTERFLCSQTIMMSLRGIPGFYIHSLTATGNDHDWVKKTRSYRSINRKSWDYNQLIERLTDRTHFASGIFTELKRLIRIRISQPAFHPDAGQEVIDLGDAFFGIKRLYQSNDSLWSISNITDQKQAFTLSGEIFPNKSLTDLIENKTYNVNQALNLNPYQTLWITAD